MTDDGTETYLVDDYLAESEEARAKGDHELADKLHAEAQALLAPDHDADTDDAVADPSDIQGLPSGSMDAYVPWDTLTEGEQDDAFEDVFARADPEMARRELQVTWPGGDYESNVAFVNAMANALPNGAAALRVLEAVGVADHPELIKALAWVGRQLAGVPGDATTIGTTTTKGKPMSNPKAIESQIRDMDKAMDKAKAEGDRGELGRLYQAQQGLYRRLPGGSDPVVGSSGGPTA